MSILTAILLLLETIVPTGDPGVFVEEPNLVGRITGAIIASGEERLTPRIIKDGDREFSYHLKSVAYIGTIHHADERFILATAFFVRSSPRDANELPARGHGFLLCLSPDFQLISSCRLHDPDVRLMGKELRGRDGVVADLSITEASRRRGFLVDGNDILPYPFSDKLPDPDN